MPLDTWEDDTARRELAINDGICFDCCRDVLPTSDEGLRDYLATGLCEDCYEATFLSDDNDSQFSYEEEGR